MTEAQATKGIDKAHGFLQDIINNQFDRRNFHLEKNIEKVSQCFGDNI